MDLVLQILDHHGNRWNYKNRPQSRDHFCNLKKNIILNEIIHKINLSFPISRINSYHICLKTTQNRQKNKNYMYIAIGCKFEVTNNTTTKYFLTIDNF